MRCTGESVAATSAKISTRGEQSITDQRGGEVTLSRLHELYVGYSGDATTFSSIYLSRCVFSPPPYPVLFPWKSQGKVKEPLAASQPRDRPTTLARDDARNVTTHCTRRIVSGCLPCTQPTSALSLMRRHYSTSRERETCFFHDNYPSPPGGRSTVTNQRCPSTEGKPKPFRVHFEGFSKHAGD